MRCVTGVFIEEVAGVCASFSLMPTVNTGGR